ncbi:hypothetical protein MXB_2792 [Myxobolus squamalis]|nr:hypothetical protein MXB_2792 [Myxobolus squamalis]
MRQIITDTVLLIPCDNYRADSLPEKDLFIANHFHKRCCSHVYSLRLVEFSNKSLTWNVYNLSEKVLINNARFHKTQIVSQLFKKHFF